MQPPSGALQQCLAGQDKALLRDLVQRMAACLHALLAANPDIGYGRGAMAC